MNAAPITIEITGLDKIERLSEMVEKIQVLEALGPNDKLVFTTDRGITQDHADALKSLLAEGFGFDPGQHRVLILANGLELEAVIRGPLVEEQRFTEAEARARFGLALELETKILP